ncbi:MAG: glycoside hydrolase family 4 [Phycisphaerae bacterium]|nr:glycoside hydrolase family 4 [Phycisphaerae bacterium]
MQHPKIVVIGAGSIFFGRQAIWQCVTSPHLNQGTLALVDTDPAHLARMTKLAEKAVEHKGATLALESSTDRREMLKDADFVVLSFARESVKYRGIDCEIAAKYGVRMCSGDTIGPGGIMRTLREFPEILNCCRDIQDICPDAWVINYINPTAANGIGLRLFAPELKSFALCDGLHMPHVKREYARRAGIIADDAELTEDVDRTFDFRIAGPNHFTWVLKAAYDGADRTPQIVEAIRRHGQKEVEGGDKGAKATFNERIAWELYEAFGYVSACLGHTKEYVRFYQGHSTLGESIPPLSLWETGDRYRWHWSVWNEVDRYNYGCEAMEQFFENTKADHATDIIEAMVGGLDKPFYINTANGSAVPNMPADAFLEMLCDVSMDAVTPREVGPAPVGLRGLWQQVLDTHELTARAAVSGDRDELLAAYCCDPLTVSLADSKAMMEELLEAEKDVLPDMWFT